MEQAIGADRWCGDRQIGAGRNSNGVAESAPVFVVEPDSGARRSLGWIFRSEGFEVVEFPNGEDLLEGLESDTAGCLLVNLRLPGMSGVALLEELGRRGIAMPVILLTGYGEAMAAVEAFRSGAFDVVGQAFDIAVVEKVRKALGVDAQRRQRRMAQAELRARLARLTSRERQIAGLIAKGHANKVIAYDLGISERTVECHRARIMHKVQAKTAAELVRIVLLAGDFEGDS